MLEQTTETRILEEPHGNSHSKRFVWQTRQERWILEWIKVTKKFASLFFVFVYLTSGGRLRREECRSKWCLRKRKVEIFVEAE